MIILKEPMSLRQFLQKLKEIPRWGFYISILWFFTSFGIYRLGMWLSHLLGTDVRAFPCSISFIDDNIPVIPAFIIIYLLSYILWVLWYALIALTGKRNFINFIFASGLAYLIGLLFFIFLPTVMDREAEGLIALSEKPGLFNWMMHVTFQGDGGLAGHNLFPSFHCISSAFCCLFLRKQEKIPVCIQRSVFIGSILICFSTVFTKQHYFIDTVGGILIALLCYLIIKAIDPGTRFLNRRQP